MDAESKIWRKKKFGSLVISFIWSFQILDMFKRLKSTIKQANLCSRTSKWTTIFISNWLRGFQNYDIFVRTCKISLFKFNTYHRWIYDSIDGPIWEFCQKFVYSFVNNECHENDVVYERPPFAIAHGSEWRLGFNGHKETLIASTQTGHFFGWQHLSQQLPFLRAPIK